MNLPQLDKKFVSKWAWHYQFHRSPKVRERDRKIEDGTKAWLREQGVLKYLDRAHLKDISEWKSGKRNIWRVCSENNTEERVKDLSQQALSPQSDERDRIPRLVCLDGVGIATATVVLHFAYPDLYPVWDKNVQASLSYLTGSQWPPIKEPSKHFDRWWMYVTWMHEHCTAIDISLRDLEKALWQFAICREKGCTLFQNCIATYPGIG